VVDIIIPNARRPESERLIEFKASNEIEKSKQTMKIDYFEKIEFCA